MAALRCVHTSTRERTICANRSAALVLSPVVTTPTVNGRFSAAAAYAVPIFTKGLATNPSAPRTP